MRKSLVISILTAIIVMACATLVNAATTSTLADELYAKGSKYGMTSADKVKIERYLNLVFSLLKKWMVTMRYTKSCLMTKIAVHQMPHIGIVISWICKN